MIQVSKEQLAQVEYLIQQSIQGNHVLFDPETVRRVLGTPWTPAAKDSPESQIERLMERPTLEAKRAYLAGLNDETYELVVRTYFNIVENSLYEGMEAKH